MNEPCYHLEITLTESLPAGWEDWFEGLSLTIRADGCTQLAGDVPDQAALHGVLEHIRDLNLRLVSLQVWAR